MEMYGTDMHGPTADSSRTNVSGIRERHATADGTHSKATGPWAGLREQRSSHKDSWSPVSIGYKAQLTALELLRRHLIGPSGGGGSNWTSPVEMIKNLDYILPELDEKLGTTILRKKERTAIHE